MIHFARPFLALPLLFGPVAAVCVAPGAAIAQPADRSITDLGDGLFRWTAGNYHSVFLVHDDGIVIGDPLSADAAQWLRATLRSRFPGKPITHVIYSHDHPDHAYGGEALDDGATQFIAHELALQSWQMTRAQVRLPDVTFDDRLTLRLPGGDTIRLDYWGANNGEGSLTMLFPRHDTLHVVDWIVLGRVQYRDLGGSDLAGTIASTRAVLERVTFSRLVGGHADIGGRAEVERYLAYMEALHDGVLEGILAGRSLDEIQRTLDLSAFSDLKMFDEWRALNIEGAYRELVDDTYVPLRPEVPAAP